MAKAAVEQELIREDVEFRFSTDQHHKDFIYFLMRTLRLICW